MAQGWTRDLIYFMTSAMEKALVSRPQGWPSVVVPEELMYMVMSSISDSWLIEEFKDD